MEAHDIIFLVYFVPSIFLFERVIFLIYAKRKDLNRYLGISGSLDSAIRFLQSADLSQLQMGRNEIDGDQAFVNRFNYETMPLSIFAFNWVNDTGAYCTGMLLGKHPLFKRISPKKSWEGSIGGAVFSIAAAFALAHFFPILSTVEWVGLGLTVVVFGTWGDLTESLMKRYLGIKDSGNILPGHGGMLDRFDSAIMAIPAAVVYLYFIN